MISAERSGILKIVMVVLVLFSGCNHTVRVAASIPSSGDSGSLGGLSSFSFLRVVQQMDSSRRFFGETISSVGASCPNALDKSCQETTDLLNYLFGTF